LKFVSWPQELHIGARAVEANVADIAASNKIKRTTKNLTKRVWLSGQHNSRMAPARGRAMAAERGHSQGAIF
jgi:hypothetical protein